MNRIINLYWTKILHVYIMKDIKLTKECSEEKKHQAFIHMHTKPETLTKINWYAYALWFVAIVR